jgi:hypothetical protein
VTGVRLSQGNTGQPTFKKKNSVLPIPRPSKTALIWKVELIMYLFMRKKIPKNICEIFLKSL